jgi:hypothetical protein
MYAEYFKTFFDTWHDGITDAIMLENAGICVNNGFSKELINKIEGKLK